MIHMARADSEVLAAMSAAANGYSSSTTWREIAETTMAEMLSGCQATFQRLIGVRGQSEHCEARGGGCHHPPAPDFQSSAEYCQ